MGNTKNILVVNDDGIEAIGIHKLAEALSGAGNVYVCSPHVQQSASGHGITIGRMVYVEDAPFEEATHAISMEGTPADCVKIGLEVYRSRGVEMDMVFSGFNHGHNLGTDTLYSGTVSAAIEGAMCGLPSAAMSISICSGRRNHMPPDHFDSAMELARKIAKSDFFSQRAMRDSKVEDIFYINKNHVILNINVPDLPPGEIKGVKACPLSFRAYDEWFQEKRDASGRVGYHYSGLPHVVGETTPDESDVIADMEHYATITPLCFDLTNYRMLETLRDVHF